VTVDENTGPCCPEVACIRTQCCVDCQPCRCIVCGDGQCEPWDENGIRCPADCAAPVPLAACVRDLGGGRYEGRFGYTTTVPQMVDIGVNNGFDPGPVGRGQPDYFLGAHDQEFGTIFDGTPLTWRLGDLEATLSRDSPPCGDSCGTGPDGTCPCDTCIPVCGHGLCLRTSNCNSCPADCGCPGQAICQYGGGCGRPALCGIEWECGREFSMGALIDCGTCPEGFCIAHRCVCAPKDGG
jgi:hypothetical protein